MHSISHFKDHYVDPVIQHPAFQMTCLVAAEVIKIIAVKIFLQYLGQRFLSYPPLHPQRVYELTVLAPLLEEIFFRLVILQGIHLVQMMLDDFSKTADFRIHIVSHVFRNTLPQEEEEGTLVIPVSPPIIEEIVFRAYMYIVNGFREFTSEEQRQQVVRVHLAALIFAAAHLGNNHSFKVGMITQFVWSYIGGVIYGYLSEKYYSLAPGMLAHGLHNAITCLDRLYPGHGLFFLVALIVNDIGVYVLGTTPSQAREDMDIA